MSKIYPAFSRSKKSKSNYELLEELKQNSLNWHEVEYQGYKLPSTEDPHSWCGDWFWKGCLNVAGHNGTEANGKGFVKTFKKTCTRASCEECSSTWISREANKSSMRLDHYEKLVEEQAKHIILSPPTWIRNKPITEQKKIAYQILKNVNAKGGCMIVHPFRRRKQKLLDGRIKSVWYPSVHFHVVGFGWINHGLVVENYRKSGWVVKDKGERDSNYATIRYILSHAGVKKRFHSLTWFGELSYSKLSMPKYESEFLNCPYCTEKLKMICCSDGTSDRPPPQHMECIIDVGLWFIPECPRVRK